MSDLHTPENIVLSDTPYVICKQLVKAYRVGDHEIVALRGIDFNMVRGEFVAIMGPSGAGKSSLLNLLGGLDRPTAGALQIDGQSLLDFKPRELAHYRLTQVGFVWQQVERNLFAHRSALRNVMLPMLLAGVAWHERRRRALTLLEAVGMAAHAHQPPARLSGGQQQRVAIGVALANQPSLLLLDEPTGALDRANALQVIELMNDLRMQFGLTILMVTHDFEMARAADRVLTLRDGALGQALDGEADALLRVDTAGYLKLPAGAQTHLQNAHRVKVEVRPEGVLLRPEIEDLDGQYHLANPHLPPDTAPQRRRLFGWRRSKSKSEGA
jgi:ABC-type lipoprotein export system ATPase subunit